MSTHREVGSCCGSIVIYRLGTYNYTNKISVINKIKLFWDKESSSGKLITVNINKKQVEKGWKHFLISIGFRCVAIWKNNSGSECHCLIMKTGKNYQKFLDSFEEQLIKPKNIFEG